MPRGCTYEEISEVPLGKVKHRTCGVLSIKLYKGQVAISTAKDNLVSSQIKSFAVSSPGWESRLQIIVAMPLG